MDENLTKLNSIKIDQTIKALKQNNIETLFFESSEKACSWVILHIKDGENISCGGSVTLKQTGILDIIQNEPYKFHSRYSSDKKERIKSVFCDTFFSSANAVTEHGELYCVDGAGSRIGPLIYGPEHVIFVVGINKIVPTLRDAVNRVKNIAAPANCLRLNVDSFCAKHGRCQSPTCHSEHLMSASPCSNSICSFSTVFSKQMKKDRIKVLIINQTLGY